MAHFKIARAGRPDDNPVTRATQAAAFVATAKGVGGVSLFAAKTESGMATWMSCEDHLAANQVAFKLAQAVGGRSEEIDHAPVKIDTPYIAYLRANTGFFRSAQMGADDTALSRILGQTLWPGAWVGATFRSATKVEQRRHRKWLSGRGSVPGAAPRIATANAVVTSIWAGAQDADTARSILSVTAASMPGLDVDVEPCVLTRASMWAGTPMVAAGTSTGFAALTMFLFGLNAITALFGAVACGALIVWTLRGVGVLSSEWKTASEAIAAEVLPAPAYRRSLRRPKKPRASRTTASGEISEGREGDYPLARSVVLMEPNIFVPIASPHGGAEADATASRTVPSSLLGRVGPRFGTSPSDEPVWLPADIGINGVAITGRPGSGKTFSLLGIAGWNMLERAHPDAALTNAPGVRQTIIAFESKDSAGTGEYLAYGHAAGLNIPVVELGASAGPVIDMFAGSGSTWDRASRFAGQMQYAFGEGQIQSRSLKALRQVFAAALLIPEALLQHVPELAAGSNLTRSGRFSVVEVAHILLGGKGDAVGVKLAAAVMSERARLSAFEPDNPLIKDLHEVVSHLATFYGTEGERVTEAARRQKIEAAESKVEELLNVAEWWDRGRPKATWSDILEQHRVVVINLGTASDGGTVMEQTKSRVGGMLMAGLKENIEAHCADWTTAGRVVSIFADELKLLAEYSSAHVEWLRNAGRSYGVRLHLATQYPEQLVPALRTAFMSFGTLISYVQSDVATAEQIAKQVGGGTDEWSAQDVLNLEKFNAIVKTNFEGRSLPAFVVAVQDFAGERAHFAEMMGYVHTVAAPFDGAPSPEEVALEAGPAPQAPRVPVADPGVSQVDLSRQIAESMSDDQW